MKSLILWWLPPFDIHISSEQYSKAQFNIVTTNSYLTLHTTWKTSPNGTLCALAAIIQWQQVPVVAELCCLYISIGFNKIHSLVKEI